MGRPTVLRCRGGAGSALSLADPKGRFPDRQHRPAQYSGRIGLIESRDCGGRQIGCFTFFYLRKSSTSTHPLPPGPSEGNILYMYPPPPPPPGLYPKNCLLYPNHCTNIGKYSIKVLFCTFCVAQTKTSPSIHLIFDKSKQRAWESYQKPPIPTI